MIYPFLPNTKNTIHINKINIPLPLQIASKITQSKASGQVVPCRRVPYYMLHRDISRMLCKEISVWLRQYSEMAQQRKSYNQDILTIPATDVLVLVVTSGRSSQFFEEEENHETQNHRKKLEKLFDWCGRLQLHKTAKSARSSG